MKAVIITFIGVLIFGLMIVSCQKNSQSEDNITDKNETGKANTTTENTTKNQTGIENPASKYCIEQGGTLTMKDNGSGVQGICTLKDGSVCDEWAYYRGECPRSCGPCPTFPPPPLDFCPYGVIVQDETDECGCVGPPRCEEVTCIKETTICPDGSKVERVPPDCDFAPCPDNGPSNSPSEKRTYCLPEQRNAEICTMEYRPVCGWFKEEVRCIKYPCAITASNPCEACKNENVEYWTEGECPK
ncbi:MAG: DUF333 domain-containing protein [Candidatus Woesearchaeota archaeon]